MLRKFRSMIHLKNQKNKLNLKIMPKKWKKGKKKKKRKKLKLKYHYKTFNYNL